MSLSPGRETPGALTVGLPWNHNWLEFRISMTFDERETLTASLRIRTAEAKDRYDEAAKRAKEVALDFRSGAIPSPDGGFALRHALKEEMAAQHEYIRLLKIWSKLAVGEIPNKTELTAKDSEMDY
jgi:hypothetical protein